jgi:hypothetical protein
LTEPRDHSDAQLSEDLRKVSDALDRLAHADQAGFDRAMQARIAASLSAFQTEHAAHDRGVRLNQYRRWSLQPLARAAALLFIVIGIGAAWLALRASAPSQSTSGGNGTLAHGGREGLPTNQATPSLLEDQSSTDSSSAAAAWVSLDALYEDDASGERTAAEDAEKLWRALGEHAASDPLADLWGSEETEGAL